MSNSMRACNIKLTSAPQSETSPLRGLYATQMGQVYRDHRQTESRGHDHSSDKFPNQLTSKEIKRKRNLAAGPSGLAMTRI